MPKKKGGRKAFSLIEILVVIAILGVLTSVLSLKSYRYYLMYRQAAAEKEYKRTLDLFSAYARLEEQPVFVRVEHRKGKTALIPFGKYGSDSTLSKIHEVMISKNLSEKEILFLPDGERRFEL
jgi:prepilin-type N-terminal cleavage/methylation domain-containing protein